MDPFTLAIIAVVLFMLFLMVTSGGRKHRLEQALRELETERMRLLKSIQHIKFSFYKKQITEEEAQKQMFGFEEKLRDVDSSILQIKDKPLMRTLDKQKEIEQQQVAEVIEEKEQVVAAERAMFAGLDAKLIVILFFVVVLAVAIAIMLAGRPQAAGTMGPAPGSLVLPMTASALPEKGTYPGSTAGLRVSIENAYAESLGNVRVLAKAPTGSGISFADGELAFQTIPEFEAGGKRDLFFMLNVSRDSPEGDYNLFVSAASEDGLVSGNATAKLIVRVGLSDRE